jgi:hypothetical protein
LIDRRSFSAIKNLSGEFDLAHEAYSLLVVVASTMLVLSRA